MNAERLAPRIGHRVIFGEFSKKKGAADICKISNPGKCISLRILKHINQTHGFVFCICGICFKAFFPNEPPIRKDIDIRRVEFFQEIGESLQMLPKVYLFGNLSGIDYLGL